MASVIEQLGIKDVPRVKILIFGYSTMGKTTMAKKIQEEFAPREVTVIDDVHSTPMQVLEKAETSEISICVAECAMQDLYEVYEISELAKKSLVHIHMERMRGGSYAQRVQRYERS